MMEKIDLDFDLKEIGMTGEFDGWASAYTTDLGGDRVLPGAFKTSLRKHGGKVPVLFNHERGKIIGVGVEALEDQRGLYIKAKLAMGTQLGRETHELMSMGALKGLSIGYSVEPKGWVMDGNIRLLKAINLHEYSAVPFGMNPDAQINRVKSLEDLTERDFEDLIRDVCGLSQKEAKTLISKGFRALKEQRDAGSENVETTDADEFLAKMQRQIDTAVADSWLTSLSQAL